MEYDPLVVYIEMMHGQARRWAIGAAGSCLLVALISAAADKAADPQSVFDELFRPLEKAMGIDIQAGKMKLNLLSGQVALAGVKTSHASQGQFATFSKITFPFGAMAGLSDPLKATAAIDTVTVTLDLGGPRFWKVSGGPIPGAPALRLGKLEIGSASASISNGKGATLALSGAHAILRKLDLPGDVWSKGEVPAGRWVEAVIEGGTVALDPHPFQLSLSSATLDLSSSTLNVNALEGSLGAGGTISVNGKVERAGGAPSRYSLVLDLDEAGIDRPGLSARATGKLTLSGTPGKLALKGKLALSDVVRLEPVKWKHKGCTSGIKLSIALSTSGSKPGKAQVKGTTCQGGIVK